MEIAIEIIVFVLTIFVLILIHEGGHFLVARLFGVKVIRFSIGFGEKIFGWHDKHGTEYVVAPIPLGGYIKMLDGREMSIPKGEKHLAFDLKPCWQKIIIVLAGPLTNILFGFLAFFLMFSIGLKVPKPIIGKILPDSISSVTGLKANDKILAVDDKLVLDWQDVMFRVFSHLGDHDILKIKIYRPSLNVAQSYILDLKNWEFNFSTKGEPDPLKDLGIETYHPIAPPVIGVIKKSSPAFKADLKKGDKILIVDGKEITNWDEFVDYIKDHPEQVLQISLARSGHKLNYKIKTDWKFGPRWKKIGYLGVQAEPLEWPKDNLLDEKRSLPDAFVKSFKQSTSFIAFNGVILAKLVERKIPMSVLGGPISVFQSSMSALNRGAVVYIGFLGMFSLMLAFVNLIPIPGLDGGHAVIFLVEGAMRKPLPTKVALLLFRLGFIFIALLIIQATLNDIMRLLS